MIAFVSLRELPTPDTARTRTGFRRKGNPEPGEPSLETPNLLFCPKQLCPVRNWSECASGSKLSSDFTPVRSVLAYAIGMQQLLNVSTARNVVRDVLVGFRCLLLFCGFQFLLGTDLSGPFYVHSGDDVASISDLRQAALLDDDTSRTLNLDAPVAQPLTGGLAGAGNARAASRRVNSNLVRHLTAGMAYPEVDRRIRQPRCLGQGHSLGPMLPNATWVREPRCNRPLGRGASRWARPAAIPAVRDRVLAAIRQR